MKDPIEFCKSQHLEITSYFLNKMNKIGSDLLDLHANISEFPTEIYEYRKEDFYSGKFTFYIDDDVEEPVPYLNEELQEKITFLADDFSLFLQKNKNNKFFFCNLGSFVPFIFDIFHDRKNNFISRLFMGKELIGWGMPETSGTTPYYIVVFEFFCFFIPEDNL